MVQLSVMPKGVEHGYRLTPDYLRDTCNYQ